MADPRFHYKTSAKSLKELADIAEAELLSGDNVTIDDVASLSEATSNTISFFDNAKYKSDFEKTKASACIVSPKMKQFAPKDCHLLISDAPYRSYALVAQAFYPEVTPPTFIHETAFVDKEANIGEGCSIDAFAVIKAGAIISDKCHIEAGAVIGENVEIGESSRIGANATVSHAIIGPHTRLYTGVRVGQDGFGFAIDPRGFVKVPQLGRVMIGSHVEIGANSCIDRGAGPDTVIGDGTWIDNLVQIGHNVKIGKGCVIIAQAGIAGSTKLEDYVVLAAQGGIAGHLTIGQGTQIGAQSGVMQNVEAGSKIMGAPALPAKQYMRQVALLKKMTQK